MIEVTKQDVKDFYWIEESPVTYGWDTSVCKTKIEVIWWSFYIEYIINPVTPMKKDTEQEDEATILSKKKLISLVRTEASDRWLLIHSSSIGNRSSPGLMTCSWASDDTPIFVRTTDPLKIKDQIYRITHKNIGSNKQHMKSPIVPPG
jgi:hypothetical protein